MKNNKNFEWTKELIQKHLNSHNYQELNIKDKKRNTGFMWACQDQPGLMRQMLNNKKVDKELKNEEGLIGYDIAKRHNQESFEVYQSWLTEQEKDHIKGQVQKRMKKPSQHL